MGTTVSSLQILGASLEDVRAALPRTLVGQWSERFVTACPDLAFGTLERKAGTLSKKLNCTILSVSMFDGDTVSLTIFQSGKRLTTHSVAIETGELKAGNPKLFCSALGLPDELVPKLKRLFTDCSSQEGKLHILQALLGTPLFVRWDDPDDRFPMEPVQEDPEPLERWLRDYPAPPKIKNQCRAELIQEIPDHVFSADFYSNAWIARGVARADEEEAKDFGCNVGDVIGQSVNSFWIRTRSDGQLNLVPLPPSLSGAFFCWGDRLLMTTYCHDPGPGGSRVGYTPNQTMIVRDTADIIPCPLALNWEGEPIISTIMPLPDGGYLMSVPARYDGSRPPVKIKEELLACYGPDGILRWTAPGIQRIYTITPHRIYATRDYSDLLALRLDGTVTAQCTIPNNSHGSEVCFLNDIPYILESLDHHSTGLLHRLTPDLQPNGEVSAPDMPRQLSHLCLSPDGTLLYAVGYESSLRVIDAHTLNILRDLPNKRWFSAAAADGQNRLWVGTGAYIECYTQSLELISRHRLKGEVSYIYRNTFGQVCAATFQQKTYTIRVYRFS